MLQHVAAHVRQIQLLQYLVRSCTRIFIFNLHLDLVKVCFAMQYCTALQNSPPCKCTTNIHVQDTTAAVFVVQAALGNPDC